MRSTRFITSVFGVLLLANLVSGCGGWLRSLRRDLEGSEDASREVASFDYNSPENRNLPPPPMNASDFRQAPIAGTPLDFSGIRAKSGRVTAGDFVAAASKNENSLWAEDGQSNYLFARNRMKVPGDLLTIQIEDSLRRDLIMEVKKLLPPDMRDQDIVVPGLTKMSPPETAAAGDSGVPGSASPTPGAERTPANTQNLVPVDETMTAEVIERFPNGNLRVRGVKRVPFRTQTRNLEVSAIIKSVDIDEKDNIKSSQFFDSHVEMYK